MKTKKLRRDEQGFASLVIALVLIVVLSLLTVGFAQLARREQQTALDKQLAIQANYAAESGANDVYRAIVKNQITDDPAAPGGITNNIDTNFCLDLPLPGSGSQNQNVGNGAKYTCEIVNMKPDNLTKDPLDASQQWATTFSASAPSDSYTIKWRSTTGSKNTNISNFAANANEGFLPLSQWTAKNRPAVLQVSLTSLSTMNRANLASNTYTVFLYPSRAGSGSPTPYRDGIGDSSDNGPIINGNCSALPANAGDDDYPCSVTLTGFGGGTDYMLRVISYYDNSKIKFTGDSGTQFHHSQAVIDSTGQARNVLKRLRVVVPIDPGNENTTSSNLPPFALEAQNICKRFDTDPVNGTIPQAPCSAANSLN